MRNDSSVSDIDVEKVSPRPLVKSAERTVKIMETLAASGEHLSLSQIHRLTGFPRSSLYELLRTLTALRWLETTDDGLSYAVGPRALLTGTAYLDRDPALPHAVRQLEALRAELGYTTHVARLDGSNVIYLASRETLEPRHVTSRVGRQLPAYATALGQAILAELTADEIERILPGGPLRPLTDRTLPDRQALDLELDQVRARGFAVEREQNTLGISCVASTVGYRIPATDAVSCSLPLHRATDREIARVSKVLRIHCRELTLTLKRAGIR